MRNTLYFGFFSNFIEDLVRDEFKNFEVLSTQVEVNTHVTV